MNDGANIVNEEVYALASAFVLTDVDRAMKVLKRASDVSPVAARLYDFVTEHRGPKPAEAFAASVKAALGIKL